MFPLFSQFRCFAVSLILSIYSVFKVRSLHTTHCVVGPSRLELPTSRLSGARSNLLSYGPIFVPALSSHSRGSSRTSGGDDEARTHDPLLAKQVLSQLSYTPICRPFRPSKLNNIIKGSAPHLPTNHRILDPVVADLLLRKEVIHPHVLVGMPCYDFTPITGFTLGSVLL